VHETEEDDEEKETKKRILPTAKRGGALPFLLGALESLIGRAASVAKAVNDNKVVRC